MDIAVSSNAFTRPFLQRQSQAELDELFLTLPPVSVSLPDGNYRGTLLGLAGGHLLPRWARRFLSMILALPVNPWRGKSFAGGEGANLWFRLSRPVEFGHYRVERDSQGHVWLDYGQPRNPLFMQRIHGEARQMGDGVLLARMNYRVGTTLVRVLYFTLERA